MKKIPLTQGKFALVDDENYEWLGQYTWHVSYNFYTYYAVTHTPRNGGNSRSIYMHRLIMGLTWGNKRQIDHIDCNGLNNQKANLRICAQQQNSANMRPKLKSRSPYKGVVWSSERQKWCVRIRSHPKRYHIGYFNNDLEAARAYDRAAIKYHGKFARLNFKKKPKRRRKP